MTLLIAYEMKSDIYLVYFWVLYGRVGEHLWNVGYNDSLWDGVHTLQAIGAAAEGHSGFLVARMWNLKEQSKGGGATILLSCNVLYRQFVYTVRCSQ